MEVERYQNLPVLFLAIVQVRFKLKSGHDFKWFPAKKAGSDWLTYLVYQFEACFCGGNHLNSCADSNLRIFSRNFS